MQLRVHHRRVVAAFAVSVAALVGCSPDQPRTVGQHPAQADQGDTVETRVIPIVYPVTVDALTKIGVGADEVLAGSRWRVRPFSAEGDAAKFGPVLEAALSLDAPAIITVGTQITNTALGPKYRDVRNRLVAAAIFDPTKLEGAGADTGPEGLGGRAIGLYIVSDHPAGSGQRLLEVIRSFLPGARSVGILTNRAELNSTASAAAVAEAAKAAGLTVKMAFLTTPADISVATRTLLSAGVDAIVIPHDKIAVAQAAVVVELGMTFRSDAKVPVFSLDDGTVEKSGVVACVSADYRAIGRYAGTRVLDMIEGRGSPDSVVYPVETIIAVSRRTAQRLALAVPSNLGTAVRFVE